jgi:predicted DNA-binding transcriptional regulator AlpA
MSNYLFVRAVRDMMHLLQCSPETLYREMGKRHIPRSFRLSAGKSAWHRDEVSETIKMRHSESIFGQKNPLTSGITMGNTA